MNRSLERRILVFSLLALTITVAVNTLFNLESFRRSYRDGILRRAQTSTLNLKTQIEQVVNLGIPLAEIDGLPEQCDAVVRTDPDIGYCLIEDASGQLLFRSHTDHPDLTSAIFTETLSPEVSVLQSGRLGKVYDYSAVLYDYDDRVIGRVRVGFPESVLDELASRHLGPTFLVLLCATIVTFALIVAFFRYDVLLPIRRLCGMATELAEGRFDVVAPDLRTRELSMLGRTMTDMAASLRERDEALQQNLSELEYASLEIQKSYERLESISAELGRSREMYRSLLEDASDAILVCDADDTLIIANKAAESFFGLPKGRIEGMNYFSFLESIRCNSIEQQFEHHRSLNPGSSCETDLRFWRESDQSRVFGRATVSAIVAKEGQLVQVIIRDATREEDIRRNLERTASEMERLNQMKNSFLGLASHELKTPLTIIMGYVELLQAEREKPLDDDALDLVRHIARASDRLAEIVRDMVDVSLIGGQTLDLVSQDVDVNVLVRRATDRAEASFLQRGQQITLDLETGMPPVRCDVERMVQAIGNVLGNAIKFTPDRGRIAIQTRYVTRPRRPEKFAASSGEESCALSDRPNPYIEIAVCDNGIGIAEAEQEAIFDTFYEVGDVEEHSTGKVAFKSRGAGLGLSIVKGIVDLHGGAVWVESPGYDPDTMPGSTFYILIPALLPEA